MIELKWLRIPFTNRTKDVSVAQTWAVRWTSRNGEYATNVRPEVEVFLSQDEAQEYAESLKLAFSLLRHKGNGTSVKVSKY